MDDDTALAFRTEKGAVVVTGCSHSGICDICAYAKEVTGAEAILAVVGGFHLSGADFETVIKPTVASLKELQPQYIVPTHCTGRAAVQYIEKEMPAQFLLNMAGTRLTFSS
jgi:7,8-dihydropterin-6-yl-methyl-4-(beta-D-ribofuranosyl)aminobenzene 5'-phosphate synthase